jgi:energy-coupling factor transporter ATP-binding protein EcfA2
MVFQSPDDQISQLTVWREVGFGPANQRCSPTEIRQRIEWAMDLVGIGELRERETNSLSGGQKQKVALAAALAMKPELLILDEPTTDLDPVSRVEFLETVRRIRAQHDLTVVVVTHEVDLISEFAERFVLVEAGTIKRDLPAPEFFAELGPLREAGLEIPQVAEFNDLMHAEFPTWPRSHRYAETLRLIDERIALAPQVEVGEEAVMTLPALWGQRLRWAEGSIRRLIEVGPGLLSASQVPFGRRLDFLAFTGEFLIPPLFVTTIVASLLTIPLPRPADWTVPVSLFLGYGIGSFLLALGGLAAHGARGPELIGRAGRGSLFLSHWLVVVPAALLRIAVGRHATSFVQTRRSGHLPNR